MTFKKKIIAGSLVIITIMVFYGIFVNEVKKLPLNYEYISEQEGKDRLLYTLGGNLSEPFGIRETLRQNVVRSSGDILEINSTILGKDPVTNNIVFYNAHTFFVDRTSRE